MRRSNLTLSLLFACCLVALSSCKRTDRNTDSDKVSVVPPSYFKPDSSQKNDRADSDTADNEDYTVKEATTKHVSTVAVTTPRMDREPAQVRERKEAAFDEKSSSQEFCSPNEFRGANPRVLEIRAGDWERVNKIFMSSRSQLLSWLEKHRKTMDEKVVAEMTAQLKNVKLHRPPSIVEPDLSWRGITVLGYLKDGTPAVRVGGGYLKLAKEQPKRAQFEMTRSLAQVWTPCKLKTVDAGKTWAPLMGCLGIDHVLACDAEEFSEEGWAVSTTLAAKISSPECKIPALSSFQVNDCLNRLPIWKEARQ